MRLFGTVLLLFLAFNLSAQIDVSKIKSDRLVFNADSSLVLVYKKKKTALFDVQEGKYLIEMSKNKIAPFFEKYFFLVFEDENPRIFGYASNEYSQLPEYSASAKHFTIKKLNAEQYLLINSGETNWDVEGESSVGYQKSGLFNCSTGEWDVKNKYNNIVEFSRYLVCQKIDSVWVDLPQGDRYFEPQLNSKISYDFYERNKAGIWYLRKKGIESNKEALNLIYGDNGWIEIDDNISVLTTFRGYGLLYFDLFEKSEGAEPDFKFKWILEPEQQFIRPSNDRDFIAFKAKDGHLEILKKENNPDGYATICKGKNLVQIELSRTDNWMKIEDEINSKLVGLDERESTSYVFGIYSLSESLLGLNESEFYTPYTLLTDEGYDSLVWSEGGEEEAFGFEEPYLGSGVYNMDRIQWAVNPKYQRVWQARRDGWLVSYAKNTKESGYPSYKEKLYFVGKIDYQFEEDVDWQDFFMDKYRVRELLLDTVKNIQLIEGQMDPFDSNAPDYYYAQIGDQFRLLNLDVQAPEMVVQSDLADFQFMSSNLLTKFSMLNDKVSFSLSDTTLYFTKPNKIVLEEWISLEGSVTDYKLSIESQDSVQLFSDPDQLEGFDRYNENKMTLEVSFGENEIIISENSHVGELFWDEMGDSYLQIIDVENSTVWRKDSSLWTKVSPYYSSIQRVNDYYIVSTASNSGSPNYDGVETFFTLDEFGNLDLKDKKQERYLLLDSNLNAISFLDHYDFSLIQDLGFGIQINTSRGAFFVTYKGEVITNDEWDSFEMKEGKLVAVRLLKDESDEVQFDDDGNEIIMMLEEIRLFEFPKSK